MEKQTYNGWSNYETWRVNLEIFDGFDLSDFSYKRTSDSWELAETLKEYAEEIIEITSKEGIARDYALAFISAVNWREIAKHIIADYADQ